MPLRLFRADAAATIRFVDDFLRLLIFSCHAMMLML